MLEQDCHAVFRVPLKLETVEEIISVFPNSIQFDAGLEKSYIGLIFYEYLLGLCDEDIWRE